MRVIHLMNHCKFANGNVHAAVDLACAQAVRGDTVCVASAGGEFVELLAHYGVKHAYIDQDHRNPLTVPLMTLQLHQLVRRFKPDVLHAHMMTGAVIGWAVGTLNRVPLVTTVHNAFEPHATLMGLGRLVVGVSAAAAERMGERGVPRRKLRAVLNGTLGAARRDFYPRQPIKLASPSIVTISALHGRKGLPDMIEAFNLVAGRVPGVELYVVGDGPDRPAYEALAAASPAAARIHFLGQLRDTKSFLEAGDIFLLASHDEPFGLVLIEAREAGCAVVATNVGGIPEALDQGTAGLLTPPRRPDELAKALLRVLEDPAEFDRLRTVARANLERWTVERMAADYGRIYAEARGGQARRASTGGLDARGSRTPRLTG
jgi:glycosyltransferase involved in cell wall biosynthesis